MFVGNDMVMFFASSRRITMGFNSQFRFDGPCSLHVTPKNHAFGPVGLDYPLSLKHLGPQNTQQNHHGPRATNM